MRLAWTTTGGCKVSSLLPWCPNVHRERKPPTNLRCRSAKPAPLRLTLTFLLSLYSFFFSASSPLFYSNDATAAHSSSSASSSSSSSSSRFQHPSAHRAAHNPGYAPSTWGGDTLKNRVFFTFMFVETMSWFLVWVTLGEERREALARRARRRSSSSAQKY